MKVVRNILCLMLIPLCILLKLAGVDWVGPVLTVMFIAFVFVITLYVCKDKKRLNVLEWDCDPERYIHIMEKQLDKLENRQGSIQFTKVNIAAAEICLGKFELARQHLLEVDTSYFLGNSVSWLAYSINLATCYYETGEIEKAEELYTTNLVKYGAATKRLMNAVETLIGERLYYLGQYEASYQQLKKLLGFDLPKQQYLSILYRLALMDYQNGDTELAKKRFEKIVKLGNGLWIVGESRKMLEQMKDE